MTTLPTARPAVQAPARPVAAAGGPTGPMPTIDPIKLLKKYKWLLSGAAVAGLIVGVVSHYALLFTYPIYRPEAIYQVFALEDKVGRIGAVGSFARDELEKFMATEVAIITSDRVIDKAISDPSITTEAPKWSSRFMKGGLLDSSRAAKSLKWRLSAGVIGESNLIRMSFWSTDPEEATAIVKLVGRVYSRDRQTSSSIEVTERKTLLNKAVTDAADTVIRLQEKRARLLKEQNVETLDQQASGELRNMESIQDQLVSARYDKESLIVQRDQLRRELDSGLPITFPEQIRKRVDEHPIILGIKRDIGDLETAIMARSMTLGPEHRDMVRLKNQLEARKQTLAAEREKLLKQEFSAQLDILTTSVNSLEAAENDLLNKLEASKNRAAEIAQTLAQVKDVTREIDGITESKAKLGDELKELDILTSSMRTQARVQLFQDAQRPKTIAFPRLVFMVPASVVLILGLVGGAVLLFEVVDQRVKSPADVAMIPRTRVLGLIPHAAEDPAAPQKIETVFRDHPGGVLAESVRQLRSAVIKRMQQGGHKSLVVMSGMPGSGATTVVCNLAHAAAATEMRVLIIDANFRRPGVHRALGLSEGPGLADCLAGSHQLPGAVQKSDDPRVDVLAAGNPGNRIFERLGTPALAQLLAEASATYDLVIIDVAPSMVAGDAVTIANRCDASMLVVRAFGEKRGMVARLRNELGESRAEFLGVLVNAVRSAAGGYFKSNILATHRYQDGENGRRELPALPPSPRA